MSKVIKFQTEAEKIDEARLNEIKEFINKLTPKDIKALYILGLTEVKDGPKEDSNISRFVYGMDWQTIGILRCETEMLAHEFYHVGLVEGADMTSLDE